MCARTVRLSLCYGAECYAERACDALVRVLRRVSHVTIFAARTVNKIGDAGVAAIASALEKNATLKRLVMTRACVACGGCIRCTCGVGGTAGVRLVCVFAHIRRDMLVRIPNVLVICMCLCVFVCGVCDVLGATVSTYAPFVMTLRRESFV
jgi:hypothetical protein